MAGGMYEFGVQGEKSSLFLVQLCPQNFVIGLYSP